MAGVRALISSLINLAANLLPEVEHTFFAASSSSSAQAPDAHALENDLKRLMRMLERIKATLYDAEERNIRGRSVKLWLKELRELGHEAEYIFDEYMYEVYRAQVEARNASDLNPVKGDPEKSVDYSVQIPYGMVERIRDIKSRFEEIANDRNALRLWEDDAPRRHSNERQPILSSPLVVEQSIFGREAEKKKVIDLLFSDYHRGEVFSVLPIVGKGGIGKTTLSQLVYNDLSVQDHFDMSGWVCVSDDFNIERIVRHVIESLTTTECNLTNLSVLFEELGRIIGGKKIFLVLDDVWNEEPDLWESLRTSLEQSKKAIILVTTRNLPVARIMQTMDPIELAYLSSDECWRLFTHYAFHGIDPATQSSFENIGNKIVQKCGGLPLAVKSIACLLRHEADAQSWTDILQSDLWEFEAGNRILAPLQISFERMPTYLKPCLLLCSMFPKDHEYDLNMMTRLWIAHGYIEPEEKKDPEEVAANYAKELYERSFFDHFNIKHCELCFVTRVLEYSRYYIDFIYRDGKFRLHDMVHDLAWLNSGKSCYSVERGVSDDIRHLYLNNELITAPRDYLGSMNIPVLQTVVVRYPWSKKTPTNLISKTEHLRALHLEGYVFEPLPIGNLKHLRYLSLFSRAVNISLQFLSSHYSLRILIIHTTKLCSLKELEGICNLINLEFLELHNISILPESLGFLRKLRVLEIYNSFIPELPECIGNFPELHRIVLTHGAFEKLPKSFCKLTNLKGLILTKCYKLKRLPEDFGKLTGLRFLLLKCPSLQYLPLSCRKLHPKCVMNVLDIETRTDSSSGALRWLKELNDLKGCLCIKNIRNLSLENAENANLVSKQYLETLLLDWSNVYEFRDCSVQKGILEISIFGFSIHEKTSEPQHHYHLLEKFQPNSSLKNLYICTYGGLKFVKWLGDPLSCASLVKLCINKCSSVRFLPLGKVHSLKQLHINNCRKLVHLNRESLPNQLEYLTIKFCFSLVEVALLQSLIKLHIDFCAALNLLSTEDGHISELESFPSLKQMTIRWCPFVKANQVLLGEDCDVHIKFCPVLKDWCLQHNFNYEK